jgi:hypothetical protein
MERRLDILDLQIHLDEDGFRKDSKKPKLGASATLKMYNT